MEVYLNLQIVQNKCMPLINSSVLISVWRVVLEKSVTGLPAK